MDRGIECPLCGETFSSTTIEGHASTCGTQASKTPKRTISDLLKGGKIPEKSPKMLKLSQSPSDNAKSLRSSQSWQDNAKSLSSNNVNGGVQKKEVLATDKRPSSVPLAETMRPKDFTAYVGQETAVGCETQLRRILESDCVPSMILWGPPGCGKTSLANVIANKVKGKMKFIKMSACTSGVSEVREMIKQAKNEMSMLKRRTVLFMDEVHRFNKAQQDSFLPHIESGVITFIGATTENPSFSLNAALLSRCKVIVLEKLSPESLHTILERTLENLSISITDNTEKGSISSVAVNYLTNIVDGDARSAINTLQILIESRKNEQHIDVDQVKEAAKRSHVLYDRTGDQHYFMASALQKSIRGSDDNAALYWLGRMLKGGEDPAFIARRLVRCASEDIGLGDPTALSLAVAAFQGSQLIGKPECDVLLAQATVHLARAKKSHEVYNALNAVYANIDQGGLPPVPLHLRNPTSKVTREMGWGQGYSSNLAVASKITYLPQDLVGTDFFDRD